MKLLQYSSVRTKFSLGSILLTAAPLGLAAFALTAHPEHGLPRHVVAIGAVLLAALGFVVTRLMTRVGRTELERHVADRTRQLEHEQARFRCIFDAAPVGLSWMLRDHPETRIVNPTHVRITGISAADNRDLNRYREATHPDDRPLQDALHARLLAGEIDHYDVDKRYVHPDGTVRWVTLGVRFQRDPVTDEIQEVNSIADITERRLAERALAEASALLETLMENTPELIYFKDANSRFVHYSKAFTVRFKLSDPKALVGKSDFDLFTREHAQAAFDDEQQIIRSGVPIVGKVEKETYASGITTWAITTKMPWRNSEGRIIGTFGLSKDVTELKNAEAKLAETHRQLVDLSREAGMAEVATGILHNVGNVLNSINVSTTLVSDEIQHSKALRVAKVAELLAEHADDLATFVTTDPHGRVLPQYLHTLAQSIGDEHKRLRGELAAVRKNVDHIKEIVAMQQSYARVAGVTEVVNVCELVNDALRMNTAALEGDGHQVLCDYAVHPVVAVDRYKVVQILVNLIANAKFACEGSEQPHKEVKVRVAQVGQRVHVSVSDNGVGIAPENLTRVFERGFTTRKNGHGFGLHSGAIAAKELGGALTAKSEGVGRGATFTLELPISTSASS